VSFGDRYLMGRPADVWRIDPRIPQADQVGEFYYARNKFDRGHLTRREDLEFGKSPELALGSAGDTCHFTNCTPQHAGFNQSRQIWQGIERHVLEEAIVKGKYNAQILTGPIFDDSDPDYKAIQYPVQYWKIVAALNSAGELFATAYLASQADVIARLGIEADVPFSPFKLFQVKISEIERLTGLSFVYGKDERPLTECDPLETARLPRRGRFSPNESVGMAAVPSGYVELMELDDIVM
jgi:endonuclease G, mitochondrial